MSEDGKLGELLIRDNFISATQLKTAQDFQRKVGGDLKDIVVKLGYVKDSTLAQVLATEQNLGTATMEINASVIDMDALKILPRALLEKHQIIPLKGEEPHSLCLAMSDPNNISAIEEVQFLVNKMVEPAVAPKAAIRKALNQLDELLAEASRAKTAATAPGPHGHAAIPAEKVRAVVQMPLDRLLRAFVLCQVERGALSVDELLARAEKL